jgi:hypothetical protein
MLRDTGLAIEYVPEQSVWQSHRTHVDWPTFRAERLRHLIKLHQPARVVFVCVDRIPQLTDLLALDYGETGAGAGSVRFRNARWAPDTIEVGGLRSLFRAAVLVAKLSGRRLAGRLRRLARHWTAPRA